MERSVRRLEAYLQPRDSYSRAPASVRASITPCPRNNIPSSPVAGDTAGNIDEFINWIKERRPSFAHGFEDTRRALLDQGISLDLVQSTKSPNEWKAYGIAPGLGIQLATYVKSWERSRNINNSSTRRVDTLSLSRRSRLPIRPSPIKNKGTRIYRLLEDTQAYMETQEDEEYPINPLEELQTDYELSDNNLEA